MTATLPTAVRGHGAEGRGPDEGCEEDGRMDGWREGRNKPSVVVMPLAHRRTALTATT